MQFEEMPSMFIDLPMWGARNGSHTFVITKDPGGFTATCKTVGAKPFDGSTTQLGKYGAYETFDDAVEACKEFAARKHG